MDYVLTIITALIGGGIVGFVQFLITRYDNKHDKNAEVIKAIKELDTKINALDDKIERVDKKGDERDAVASRVRILRFRDEMLKNRGHTHESYLQVLNDIDNYERFCSDNKDFKNNQTIATIEHIKESYRERLERHDFL